MNIKTNAQSLAVSICLAIIGVTFVAGLSTTRAADAVWTNVSGNTDFNTGANWTGGTGTGGLPALTQVVDFTGVAVGQPNVSSAATVSGLFFTATASGYDLTSGSGNTVALTLTSIATAGTGDAVHSTAGTGLVNTVDAALILGGGVGSSQSIDQSGAGTLVINGVISGNNPTMLNLITASNGRMTLAGMNTFTANVTIGSSNGVTVSKIGNSGVAGNLGAGSTINLGNGVVAGTLNYTGAGETSNRAINLSGASGGATIDTTGATGALVLSGAWSATGVGAKLVLLQGNNTGNNSVTGGIVDNSSANPTSLRKDGVGTWVLSDANTYTGQTDIRNGILSVSSINSVNGGTPLAASSGLGAPTTIANGTILLGSTTNTGQLTYTGNGETTDRALKLNGTTGGGTIDQSGLGQLRFSSASAIAMGAGSKTLTLQGSTSGVGQIDGIIQNNSTSNKTSLTKQGTGKWILAGANTYTGVTLVNGGTLIVNGSLASGSAVSLGAAALGGSGTVSGTVTTAGTASVLTPGNGSTGILTLGALNAASGADFIFELGTASDLINIAGAFTGSVGAGGLLFDFSDAGGLAAGTAYTLMTFGSSADLDYTDLAANSLPSGIILDASFGTNGFQINGGSLQVQFSAVPEPTAWAMVLGGFGVLAGVGRFRRRG